MNISLQEEEASNMWRNRPSRRRTTYHKASNMWRNRPSRRRTTYQATSTEGLAKSVCETEIPVGDKGAENQIRTSIGIQCGALHKLEAGWKNLGKTGQSQAAKSKRVPPNSGRGVGCHLFPFQVWLRDHHQFASASPHMNAGSQMYI